MTRKPVFALNHMAAPRLSCRQFLDLAAELGCAGVELRNDLADKKLSTAAFFDGEAPAAIGAEARARGLKLYGLSEAYGFNAWSGLMKAKVERLIDQARESGAGSISLIPRNDNPAYQPGEGEAALRQALGEILPLLDKAGLVALIEPLGFATSSLRAKAVALAAIAGVGGTNHFRLVHDTFHHHLAGETQFFPAQTGIVHISGVVDKALAPEAMQDAHRILVDAHDRLGNIAQIKALLDGGYDGAFSFEPFAPAVHAVENPKAALRASMDYIAAAVADLK